MQNNTHEELLALGDIIGTKRVSSSSVSLNQKIKEAKAVEEMSKQPRLDDRPQTRQQRVVEAKKRDAAGKAEQAKNKAAFSTSDTAKVRAVEGKGPFNENFEFLAKTNPEAAQAELDSVRGTLAIPGGNAPTAKPERIWQGTHTGSEGQDVPYYTNLPAGARMDGVRDIKRYEASAPATKGLGGEGGSSESRAVAQKLDTLEGLVKHGTKSDDVVAREASKHLPGFLGDIKKYGKEEAAKRQFLKVGAGTLSDDAYKRMHSEAAPEAAEADAMEFATTRANYTNIARTVSATDALAQIDEDISLQKGNAKHLLAVRREIAQRARPFASGELLTMPDLYYPYSRADVEKVNKRKAGADPTGAATATAEEANVELDKTVRGAAGTPSRTLSSYLGIPNPTPRPQRQSQRVGNAELGYEIGEFDFPDYPAGVETDAVNWLAGGGDTARGRRNRERRAARRKTKE